MDKSNQYLAYHNVILEKFILPHGEYSSFFEQGINLYREKLTVDDEELPDPYALTAEQWTDDVKKGPMLNLVIFILATWIFMIIFHSLHVQIFHAFHRLVLLWRI